MIRSHSLSSSSTTSSSSSPLPSQFCPGNSNLRYFSSLSFPCKFASSFLTLTSSTNNRLSVKCARPEYLDQQRFATSEDSSYALRSPSHVPRPVVRDGASPRRVFVGHSIYKGKAALTVNPRPPEFVALESGAYKVSKDGYVLLQFAPAVGVRQYDWTRKQVFSLSVPEMGNLICLGMRESREFFHDPFKGNRKGVGVLGEGNPIQKLRLFYNMCLTIEKLYTTNMRMLAEYTESHVPPFSNVGIGIHDDDEGKVRKVLKVEPLPDGSGHFFNLTVQNKLENVDESIYIPITRAEFAVFNSLFHYIMPYLLGWHSFANSIGPDRASRVNNGNPRYGGDFEWSR